MKSKEGYDETKRKTSVKKTKKEIETTEENRKRTSPKKNNEDCEHFQIYNEIKEKQYNYVSLNTCIRMAKEMKVNLEYGDYMSLLVKEDNIDKIVEELLSKVDVSNYSFEEDGYDADLFKVLLQRIRQSMRSDFANVRKENLEYVLKEVLRLAKSNNINNIEKMNDSLKIDLNSIWKKFMHISYEFIQTLAQVNKYESFVFDFLSQFNELHNQYANEILMDIADLYIRANETKKGNHYYEYLLRDSDDTTIIIRWAKAYCQKDMDMAREIAKKGLSKMDSSNPNYNILLEILI